MAVIVNALRALRAAPNVGRLDTVASALARRFSEEHASIKVATERLRTVAHTLGTAGTATALAQVRQVHRMLVEAVVPHEDAEDRQLYPALRRAIGGTNPTAPTSREHVEIAHQVRRLGQLLDDVGQGAVARRTSSSCAACSTASMTSSDCTWPKRTRATSRSATRGPRATGAPAVTWEVASVRSRQPSRRAVGWEGLERPRLGQHGDLPVMRSLPLPEGIHQKGTAGELASRAGPRVIGAGPFPAVGILGGGALQDRRDHRSPTPPGGARGQGEAA